jgi:hypothetical protein
MKNDDRVRELLPFYVAGTLKPSDKARVEEALKGSEDLRMDLQFWQQAQKAVVAQEAYNAAGHLTAKQVMDFAENGLTGDLRSSVENHLQSCGRCSEEYALVKSSLSARKPIEPTMSGRLMNIIQSIRWVYAIPAVALMIVAVILYFNSVGRGLYQPSVPSIAPPIIAEIPHVEDESMPLRLTYQSDMRSTSRKNIPTLSLGKQHKEVDAFIAIPHNTLSGIRYYVEIGSGEGKSTMISDSLQRYASGPAHDSLHVVLPRSIIPHPGDTLTIVIKEILPANLGELTPEEYRLSVLIAGSDKR